MAPFLKGIIVSAAIDKGQKIIAQKTGDVIADRIAAEVKQKLERKYQMNTAILGAVRHVLQLAAGTLVAKGVIDAAGVELMIGAGTSVVTLGWYLIELRLKRT